MIQLHSRRRLEDIELGNIVQFHIAKEDESIETRFFLTQRPVIYTRPLKDWTTDSDLLIFPEAPGDYSLATEWRMSTGECGWLETEFSVRAPRNASPQPHAAVLDKETTIWLPNAWEGDVVRVSEKASIGRLEAFIHPGTVVYDLGANVGVYAVRMARLAGPTGRVVCVEANPICVQFLRTNLLLTEHQNIDILPVAVLDTNSVTKFTLNYSNSNLGLSEVSGHYGVKAGHEVRVPCYRLDYLIATFHLRPPEVIKMDVEGAEHLAILGMRETLEIHRPVLLLELHGEICSAKTLEVLDQFDYRYCDPESGDEFSDIGTIVDHYADTVFQLLALPNRTEVIDERS